MQVLWKHMRSVREMGDIARQPSADLLKSCYLG